MVSYQIFLQKITIIIVLLFVTLTLFRLGFFEVLGLGGGGGGGRKGGRGASINPKVLTLMS